MGGAIRRRATTADIAAAVGVSRTTVSFVLNDTPGQTISPHVIERVRAEADRLGYHPHLHARALVSGQSRVVLVVLPDWPVEHLLRTLLDEAAAALDEAGYSMVTMDLRRSVRTRPLWETLQPDVVMAVGSIPDDQAHSIQRLGLKLITPPGVGSSVMATGPELQTQHLVDRGHVRIAYASTPVQSMSLMDHGRLRAVEAAVGREVPAGVMTADSAPCLIRDWHVSGITGIVCFNDDVAATAASAALRLGLRIPQDLAIIGHDDSPIANLMFPSLSTIQLDTVDLGRDLAERALAEAAGRTFESRYTLLTSARVVVREST